MRICIVIYVLCLSFNLVCFVFFLHNLIFEGLILLSSQVSTKVKFSEKKLKLVKNLRFVYKP